MTEAEIAELALMHQSYVLELEMMVQGYTATVQSEGSMLLSLIFGYLLAAHFIGALLSKTQVVIFNAIYTLTTLSSLTIYVGLYETIVFSLDRLTAEAPDLASRIPIGATQDGAKFVIAAYFTMIIASLYFMWTVRHSDKLANRETKPR
jgi:hypothetical protein